MRTLSVDQVREEAAKRNLRLALIVTALDLELQAVIAHLIPLASVKGRDGVIYECGVFHDVGQDWLVIVAETGAGTHQAQAVITSAHMQFEPELQIFVGVGGSRKSDIPIGSVVAADHVYMPYGGKYDERGFSGRPREFAAHPHLLSVARKVRRDKAWIARIRDPADGSLPPRDVYPVTFPPVGHIAPAVSTEAVVADTKGDLAELIAKHFADACIVEMEGYGAIYAASQELKPAIVVRGVSDMTENKEPGTDAIRQPIAACHAAAFAFELLVQWNRFYPKGIAAALPTSPDTRPPAAKPEERNEFPDKTRHHTNYVLNLDSELSALPSEHIAAIETLLRELTSEPDLRIEKFESRPFSLALSSPTNAVARIDASKLREALESGFALHLFGLVPEHELQELGEITDELLRASSDLLAWPSTLPDGEWLERPELQTLLKLPRENLRSATAIIGPPGSGKSALLAALSKKVTEQGYPVLAIKADLLDTEITNEADLRAWLELSDRPSTLLTRVAAFRPTFLLIDQLDALAGYLDLRTGRLNAVLNLVRRLGKIDNVHIVLSARRFEYEHDVRLRSISAESLTLQLPAWSQVLTLLESKGIKAAGWPTDAQEVLRSPQALATYLRLSESQRSEPLGSYHAMLDRLWTEHVLKGSNGPRCSQLAGTIADTMAEEESLWVARARYDHAHGDIAALIGAGVLTLNTAGVSIGFAHQTVFDYALARAFAQERRRLSSYVLERQSSLFVRPKALAALSYLRATDPNSYIEELREIWDARGLRRHLRLLLIDFLGQQTEPLDAEVLLMEQALKSPGERAVAFRAMTGSAGWFRRFARSYIADAMGEGAPAADWATDLLISAWSNDPAGVTSLLRQRWLGDNANDARVWVVIQRAPVWAEEMIDIAVTVLSRTEIAAIFLDNLVAEVGVDQPEVALRLLRAGLERELKSAQSVAAERAAKAKALDASFKEMSSWYVLNNPRDPIKRLVETSNDWDSVPALSGRAPSAFLDLLWPWLLGALNTLLEYSRDGEPALGYPLTYGVDYRFEGEHTMGLPEPSLLAAARTAVEKLAADAPDELRAWIAANKEVALAPVQRLIAHSFTANAGEFAEDALTFLSEDHRRLCLGGIQDVSGTTTRLIGAVSDHWSEAQVRSFEMMVWNFKPAAPSHLSDAPARRNWQNVLRRLRLSLLRALPARRASDQTRRRLQEEERAFPDNSLGVTYSGVRSIGSIMSATDIRRASDEDVLKAFQRLPDSTGWDHPRNWEKGGNVQLAREFANFAKEEPDRALRLIERFAPEFGTRGAGYALESMGETANPIKLMQAIVALADRGFEGSEFRGLVAMAVDRLLNRGVKIEDAVVDLFRRWLTTSEASDPDLADEAGQDEEADQDEEDLGISTVHLNQEGDDLDARSLLWGMGGLSIVPTGAYPVLQALVRTYLINDDTRALGEILEDVLDHVHDKKTWQHLLLTLIHLRPQKDDDAGRTILKRLFGRFPEFVGTKELAFLLGHINRWAPDLVEDELVKWREARGRGARRGYGELVSLMALLHPKRCWSQEALEAIVRSKEDRDARAGAATTAVNLWGEPAHRARATELLVSLLPDASSDEWSAVFDLFRLNDELTPEPHTVALLESIVDNMQQAPRLESTFVVDRLATLLPHEAPLVARIAEALVRKWHDELGNIRTGTAATAPQLVHIAVTLHRLGPATREDGTRLFEQLLDIDAYTARATLDEIDNRFRHERIHRRPRLPRRTQQQRRRTRTG